MDTKRVGPNNVLEDVYFYDLETTGTRELVDRPIQLGAVRRRNGVWEKREWLIDPGISIPEEVQKLTGITPADIKERGISFADAHAKMEEFTRGTRGRIGYNNKKFDDVMYQASLERAGLDTSTFTSQTSIDMFEEVNSRFGAGIRREAEAREKAFGHLGPELGPPGKGPTTLEHILARFGIAPKARAGETAAHTAMWDARATANVAAYTFADESGKWFGAIERRLAAGVGSGGGRVLSEATIQTEREAVATAARGLVPGPSLFSRIPTWGKVAGAAGLVAGGVWAANKIFGKDDYYNTIEGMGESGYAARLRKQRTDFGSGYKGPNPWLSPDYNAKEETPHLELMRASQLGKSKRELVKYFTQKEQASEYLLSTASAGTALHLIEEASQKKSGKAAKVEQFVFDPVNKVSGHVDIINQEGAPVDIKTVAPKRLKYLEEGGQFPKHTSQINFYMAQLGAKKGYLEYINREDRSQRKTVEVNFSQELLDKDLARMEEARSEVRAGIDAGQYSVASLPRGASIETLTADAAKGSEEVDKNMGRMPYLENVYTAEMAYFHGLERKRQQSMRNNRIPGRDDYYNTIQGLHPGAPKGSVGREAISGAFGSGWQGLAAEFSPQSLKLLLRESIDDLFIIAAKAQKHWMPTDAQRRLEEGPPLPGAEEEYQPVGVGSSFTSIPTRGNAFNGFGGFSEVGQMARMRHQGTAHGSKTDAAKLIAGKLGMTFEEMLVHESFQSALTAAIERGPIKTFQKGRFGSAALYEAEIAGERLPFVRKSIKLREGMTVEESISQNRREDFFDDLLRHKGPKIGANARRRFIDSRRRDVTLRAKLNAEEGLAHTLRYREETREVMRGHNLEWEGKVLSDLHDTPSAPSAYRSSKSELLMEYMSGEELSEVLRYDPHQPGLIMRGETAESLGISAKHFALAQQSTAGVEETLATAVSKGYMHRDIRNLRNLVVDQETQRIGILDWGYLGRKGGESQKEFKNFSAPLHTWQLEEAAKKYRSRQNVVLDSIRSNNEARKVELANVQRSVMAQVAKDSVEGGKGGRGFIANKSIPMVVPGDLTGAGMANVRRKRGLQVIPQPVIAGAEPVVAGHGIVKIGK